MISFAVLAGGLGGDPVPLLAGCVFADCEDGCEVQLLPTAIKATEPNWTNARREKRAFSYVLASSHGHCVFSISPGFPLLLIAASVGAIQHGRSLCPQDSASLGLLLNGSFAGRLMAKTSRMHFGEVRQSDKFVEQVRCRWPSSPDHQFPGLHNCIRLVFGRQAVRLHAPRVRTQPSAHQ